MEGQARKLPERGLGHILAVAHWLNDVDVMSPCGGNVGYQLQLDEKGQLYAESCKIDPGCAFNDFDKPEMHQITNMIRIAMSLPSINGSNFLKFSKLPQRTQQEYLSDYKKNCCHFGCTNSRFF